MDRLKPGSRQRTHKHNSFRVYTAMMRVQLEEIINADTTTQDSKRKAWAAKCLIATLDESLIERVDQPDHNP